jgi:HlyD family secretion protein
MKIRVILLISLCIFVSCNKHPKKDKTVPIKKDIDKALGIAHIEPENGLLDLTTSANGKIIQLFSKEGDRVKKNQILGNVDNLVEKAQLKQAESKLATQQMVIAASLAALNSAKTDLDKAQKDYDRTKNLFSVKAATQQNLDDSQFNLEKLKQNYDQASQNLSQARFRLIEMKADIAYYQSLIVEKQIKAPFDGKILSLDAHVGNDVVTTTVLGQFYPDSNLLAVTEVDELFADKVQLGQHAIIYSQATGKELGRGIVIYAGDFLKKKSLFSDETQIEDRRVRPVKVRLTKDSKALIGSRVDCTILFK